MGCPWPGRRRQWSGYDLANSLGWRIRFRCQMVAAGAVYQVAMLDHRQLTNSITDSHWIFRQIYPKNMKAVWKKTNVSFFSEPGVLKQQMLLWRLQYRTKMSIDIMSQTRNSRPWHLLVIDFAAATTMHGIRFLVEPTKFLIRRFANSDTLIFSELTFTFAICCRPSVCLTVCRL